MPDTYSDIVAAQYGIKRGLNIPDLLAVAYDSERPLLRELIVRANHASPRPKPIDATSPRSA